MVADIWSSPDVDAGRRGGRARAARAFVCARRSGSAAAFLLAALMWLAVAQPRHAEGQVLHVYL